MSILWRVCRAKSWERSVTVEDNASRLLFVKLTHRSFNAENINAERLWCCAHLVQFESEYFALMISRWWWNDGVPSKCVAIEILLEFCDEVVLCIWQYFESDTLDSPTQGELDADEYLGMRRLLETVTLHTRGKGGKYL